MGRPVQFRQSLLLVQELGHPEPPGTQNPVPAKVWQWVRPEHLAQSVLVLQLFGQLGLLGGAQTRVPPTLWHAVRPLVQLAQSLSLAQVLGHCVAPQVLRPPEVVKQARPCGHPDLLQQKVEELLKQVPREQACPWLQSQWVRHCTAQVEAEPSDLTQAVPARQPALLQQ